MSQETFLELSKRFEKLKKELKELEPKLIEAMKEIGIGNHFQDSETKAVYEIIEPSGTFIAYKNISYNRTKLEGETKGTLSIKKAKELGYDL